MLKLALLAATIAVLLPGPATALADTCVAQPGQGAIDQYCELVPSGAGDRPSATTTPAPAPATTPAQRTLNAAGSDGRAVTELARSAPKRAAPDTRATRKPQLVISAPPRGTLDAVGGDLGGGPGGDDWLVWALVALAGGAGGAALVRARRRRGG